MIQEIKKYRRKVSEKKIRVGAEAMFKALDYTVPFPTCVMSAKAILEATADSVSAVPFGADAVTLVGKLDFTEFCEQNTMTEKE